MWVDNKWRVPLITRFSWLPLFVWLMRWRVWWSKVSPVCGKLQLKSYVLKPSSYLEKGSTGNFKLKKTRQYFYQCQHQIFTGGKLYCDFVVSAFDHDGRAKQVRQRISPDEDHWKVVEPKLTNFWRKCILLEVLGRWCTRCHNEEPNKIVNFLQSRPITLSTWICTLAIPLVFSTSTGSSWSLPLVNVGMARWACWNMTLSWIVKPRSAKFRSPGKSFFNMPQFSVRNFSEVLPPHAFETKDRVPEGVIPINTFTVLWCL